MGKLNKLLPAVLIMFLFIPGFLKAQHNIPDDFCVNFEELKLYNLVNAYRKQNGLDDIPLSKNLCYVAKLHVNDLHFNRPDTANCNLHSWSDKGDWLECCYGPDIYNNTCMTSKPKELTTYPGLGYEIAFWESVDAMPEIVIDLWKSSEASNDMILNRANWKDMSWKAFGVGVLKGYAVVWFGAGADAEEGVKICNTDEIAGKLQKTVLEGPDIENNTSGIKYYLIISSWKDMARAKAEVKKFKSRGFRNPSVLKSGDNYRVSLGTYPTKEKAVKAKSSLSEKYKEAWILKQ
ncbi:MAG: hypothetical protein B6D64_01670 [Bacteroidetes bacterium 4484_276]|nr:MAG: hypothetical protein B6D64_01670 [Bacteroidetes bacterium 4484_276]